MKNDTNNNSNRVLIVDDEVSLRRTLSILLKSANYDTVEADTISSASKLLSSEKIDLVIVDLQLGDENGIDLIHIIKQKHSQTEAILITGYGSIENSVEAMQAGAFDYITKPFSNSELLMRISKALERKNMRQELQTLRQHVAMSYGFDNIVGISKIMEQVKETAKRVAPTDITVLITGASGTGKELFARAIHHHSQRRNGSFVAIDCSAIPETLLESELFGHIKGSFTSASRDKRGLLEEADGGTVFLDEISNMPLSVQVKLLRFLQDSIIKPVGSSVSRKVDVRIVGATNTNLAEMIAKGKFRDDLYYRLSVIPINLPSLIDRPEDIEILTHYFLRKIVGEINREGMTISRDAVEKLRAHHWPGNVRELENTLKRGATLCTTNHLESSDIIFITSDQSQTTDILPSHKTKLRLKGNTLDNNQRTLIVKALNDNKWNYTKTASELGIGRTTLWRKIKKYDLGQEVVSS